MLKKILSQNPLKVGRTLFYLDAAIWLGLGMFSLLHMASANPESALVYQIVGLMMFVNAGALLVSGYKIVTQRRSWYFFALVVLLVNIVLTFTDEFGMFDFFTQVLDLVILALLIGSWRKFTSSQQY
jgi:hypothetical protein